MCDQQQRTVIGFERLFELLDGGEIEVVRRLIENQHIRATGLQQRKARAGSLTGREIVDRAFHMICAQPELREQSSHIGGRP
jgi:hypothetical protein